MHQFQDKKADWFKGMIEIRGQFIWNSLTTIEVTLPLLFVDVHCLYHTWLLHSHAYCEQSENNGSEHFTWCRAIATLCVRCVRAHAYDCAITFMPRAVAVRRSWLAMRDGENQKHIALWMWWEPRGRPGTKNNCLAHHYPHHPNAHNT